MAETYSVEYTNAYIAVPRGNNYAHGRSVKNLPVHYTQVLAGAAADTMLLGKLPPKATVAMWQTRFWWTGFTSGCTLSLGWQAYIDEDGVTQAASATGLLSAVSLMVAGGWNGAMLIVATPDDSLPVVNEKVFNNRTEVTLFMTFGTQAPGVNASINGGVAFYSA